MSTSLAIILGIIIGELLIIIERLKVMEDLIKRKDAIKAEADRVYKVLRSEGCKETYEDCLADAEKTFKDIPSAENKGEWKHLKGDEWLCSNCGYVVWTEGSWEHPLERGKDYCEHCGAHMKGADDDIDNI